MSSDKKKDSTSKIKEQQSRYYIDERFEIIEGVRYEFLSSPKVIHQELLGNLHVVFRTACSQDGITLMAPLDVHLDDNNIFQPDLIYISCENRAIIRDGFVFGAPDLVVEILSGSTASRDKRVKKAVYEKHGVKEFWIADPHYQLIEQFVLLDGAYQLIATLAKEDRLLSQTVPCLSIDLADIFPDREMEDLP